MLRSRGFRGLPATAPVISSSGKRPPSDGKPLLTDGGGPARGEEGRFWGVNAGCEEGVAPTMASELSAEPNGVDMVHTVP